ncbi:esterase/lipase [Opitutaceae bacterium TAV1]|nr:esterase/lipase [Opitutaceae bacterium TAV1]
MARLPVIALLTAAIVAARLSVSTVHAQASGAPAPAPAGAAIYKTESGLPYYEADALAKAGDYQRTRCRLDLHYPANRPGYPTLIWLHGGGLTGGRPGIPAPLREKELGLVSPGYRFSPEATPEEILEDAAAVVAWTVKHISERGGDPKKIFLSGHSAGGYLAAVVGMDPRWLAPHGLKPADLAGLIPVSAQVSTHFQVKKVRGDTGPEYRVIVDEYAPLYHASQKNLPPICLIVGDRRIEYKNRIEENDLFATSLRNLGHTQVEFYEMGGLNHSTVRYGAWTIIPGYIKRILERNLPPSGP